MSSRPDADPSGDEIARDVVEHLLEGCQVVGFDWRYLYVNDAAAQQGQRPRGELLGRTMPECYPGIEHTAMFAELQRCMTDRAHGRMENEFIFPDGSKGYFELRFVPVDRGVCVLSMDVTERRRSEEALALSQEQLRHAQKMEAVGRLAGGVAHDFNNVLSVVLGYAGMILADLGPDAPIRADLDEIQKAGLRGAALTRQLLTFSRQQATHRKAIDLGDVVEAMEGMVRRLAGEGVEVTQILGADLGRVMADTGQVEQVLMNLVVNARDAMPEGGRLTIQTRNVELDDDYARMHHGVAAGPHVMLAVTDTGTGMDKATQARIFEPFFTTKATGRGTGIGLATVFGIVQQSHGHVWVYSEPGHGTTFKVYFPLARGDGPPDASPPRPAGEGEGGSETILLVEDDDQVRAGTSHILRRAGYAVLEAANADEALRVSERFDGRIDLLLTDVVLPRVAGPQIAERLVASRPDLKVLFMSGYTDEAVVQHGMLDVDAAYVEKPITVWALRRHVRGALGPPGALER